MRVLLGDLAYARSGDKGGDANIGVIAFTEEGYAFLEQALTAEIVLEFIRPLGVKRVTRYTLPNLEAFNFICCGVLAGGASLSLRSDAQGKALGQALLELPMELPEVVEHD